VLPVTLDTNIYVSALGFGGTGARLWLWVAIRVDMSKQILR